VGAKILIDLTGTNVFESAPDAVKYSWYYMEAAGPPGSDATPTPNYDYTHYPLLSQYAYAYVEIEEGRDPYALDLLSTSMVAGSRRMYSVHVPTMYPPIESNGLMDPSHAFRYSWLRAAYLYDASGTFQTENSGDTDANVTGYYGNWNIMDTYYLDYALTNPTYFPVLTNSTEGGPFAEFHLIGRVLSNAPRTLDGQIPGPTLYFSDDDGYRNIYDEASLTDEQKKQAHWPLYNLTESGTDHASRDYRNTHASFSTSFNTYQGVWRDLYERYYHPDFNRVRRDEYVNKRVSSLEIMLKIAESLPKENRVRMQPQAQIQDSQLGYLPMSSAIDSESSTAPTTTPTVSTGGGGGMSSY
jgi:hypothetical protein